MRVPLYGSFFLFLKKISYTFLTVQETRAR